jgi:hypothetical protein
MRFLTLKAILVLLVFDALGFSHNFAKMHRFVSRRRVAPQLAFPDALERICNAVNNGCVWYPKRVRCLQRSVAITCMLRHYGVAAHMVMGAQKVPFKAHAWTEVDGRAINERNDVQKRYGVWERC